MSSRREAREKTLQALYAYELGGGNAKEVMDTVLRERLAKDKESLRFAEKLFLRTVDTKEEADTLVSRFARNWELSRIALVDRILLRMAISELLGFEDIPPKVTMNETIEIAKKFSTSRSGQFVNGILDSVLIEFQNEGRLKKTGRGLVGMDSIEDRKAH